MITSSIIGYSFTKVNIQLESGDYAAKYYCKDPEGLPFIIGNQFISWIDNKASSKYVVENYANDVFLLLDFFYIQNPKISFRAPVNEIRRITQRYIQDTLRWHTRKHRNGNILIESPEVDKNSGEPLTSIKLKTLQNRINSWKQFYKFCIESGFYNFDNPFGWVFKSNATSTQFLPTMPPKSGMSLPNKRRHFETNSFFCVVEKEWEPRFIGDSTLPEKIYKYSYNRGIYLILRILFESGARIHEVLYLNIGDWRKLRGIDTGARAISKGSFHERVKTLHWTVPTDRMINNYVNNARKNYDMFHRGIEDLPDDAPLFINSQGNRYTRDNFYKHFRKICKKAKIELTVHMIRHWFVTSKIININKFVAESEREAYRNKFIRYMGWKSKETIKVYDHFIDQISDKELFEVFKKEYSPKHSNLEKPRNSPILTPEIIKRNLEFQKFLNQEFENEEE